MVELHHCGEGFPIVCLHGWGFDHTIWQHVTDWPQEWQIISVDLPGHGQTNAMSMEVFTSELLKQLPQTFAVIGWSLGGLYAFELAKQAGIRMKHLFAVATSPYFMKQECWPGIETAVLTRFYKRYIHNPIATVLDFIELQFLNHPNKAKLNYSPALPNNAEQGLTLLQKCDFRNQLQLNPNDVSFLLGKQDAIVPATLAGVLNSQLNMADVCVVKQCGHMPFLSHSDLFINHIRERL